MMNTKQAAAQHDDEVARTSRETSAANFLTVLRQVLAEADSGLVSFQELVNRVTEALPIAALQPGDVDPLSGQPLVSLAEFDAMLTDSWDRALDDMVTLSPQERAK